MKNSTNKLQILRDGRRLIGSLAVQINTARIANAIWELRRVLNT